MPAEAGIHEPVTLVRCQSMRRPCLYILASKPNGTLYVGVTNDVIRRIWEHKSDVVDGFTKQYGMHTLYMQSFMKLCRMQFSERSRSRNGEGRGKFT